MGLLSFEGFGPFEGFGREGTSLPPVRAGFGLEALETVLAVEPLPAT
jgi:hypothetical protein